MKTRTKKNKSTADGAMQRECPACSNSQMMVFFEVENVPVFCNVLWPSRAEAIAASRAPIRLAYCHQCGLIYNIAFKPQLIEYSAAYENSLYFSPRFQAYAEDLACRLVRKYQLYDKDIIEIGCGQGDFLALLQRLGNNRVLGFDPSYSPDKTVTEEEDSAVRILPEVYTEKHARQPADFICCRHVLEHIGRPLDFLRSIRNTIGPRYETVVFFEVPNALYTLKDMGVWDIIYEHCSYFTSESLANIFMRAGFAPIRLTEQYDGQFLTIEARPAAVKPDSGADAELALPNIQDLINSFHKAYKDKVDSQQHSLSQFEQQEKRVVLWGAGSKGVTFLNTLDISDQHIEYIVDLNPRKHGQFVPGTGQQVIAPEFLKEYRPQTIIIVNPIYRAEIQQIVQELGLTSELMLA